MFGERGDSAEGLAALVAFDLHATVGVHSLVTAQIGELGVALEADLTSKQNLIV